MFQDINKDYQGKVVTKISLLKNYCPAEEYHQKYLEKDKNVISRDELVRKNINNVKIIDCSWHMPQTKRDGLEEYKKNHIPNAIF